MTLDMRPMLRGEMTVLRIDFTLKPEELDDVTFDGDAHVTGTVTDSGGYMRLNATVTLPYHGECARCLAPASGVFTLAFDRTVAAEGTLSEEMLEDNVDEYLVIQDGKLELDEEIREALILAFPMRLLCDESCPGLCPKCGKRLADGACGCTVREIDPRLAVLGKLLDRADKDKTK